MSLEAKLRRDLLRLRELMARRRNETAAPRPLDFDALAGGGRERLPPGLFERSPITDPVAERIARDGMTGGDDACGAVNDDRRRDGLQEGVGRRRAASSGGPVTPTPLAAP
jgi:hypothetical protein